MTTVSPTNVLAVVSTWEEMKLDTRIIEAMRGLKWHNPTLVQQACIPQIFQGRDVAVQARTGTGKTGAFIAPVIQRILRERDIVSRTPGGLEMRPYSLVIVPSVELATQTVQVAIALSKHIRPRLVVEDCCARNAALDSVVISADIVICTAAVLSKSIKKRELSNATLSHLRIVVCDEADWLVDTAPAAMYTIQKTLAMHDAQCVLLSATLTDGVASMKGNLQKNPTSIVLSTEDEEDDITTKNGKGEKSKELTSLTSAQNKSQDETKSSTVIETRINVKDTDRKSLKQYYLVAAEECHEHTLLFALYRIKLISGKTLIFVEDEEETYRLQTFLEQLGIASAVYDTHVPVNVRMNVLNSFQTSDVATLICTDSTFQHATEDLKQTGGTSEEAGNDYDEESKRKSSRREKNTVTASTSNDILALHRGIDFSNVQNVILFNSLDSTAALSFNKYIHRVGRAGRAGQDGNSFLILRVPQAQRVLNPLKAFLKATRNELIRPFKKMLRSDAAKLQYRVDSALSRVTRTSTRRLRVANVAAEIARSNYLSSHMSDKDNEALRAILMKSKKKVTSDPFLLDLPKYMRLRGVDKAAEFVSRVNSRGIGRKEEIFKRAARRKHEDPLKAIVKNVQRQAAEKKRAIKAKKKIIKGHKG